MFSGYYTHHGLIEYIQQQQALFNANKASMLSNREYMNQAAMGGHEYGANDKVK